MNRSHSEQGDEMFVRWKRRKRVVRAKKQVPGSWWRRDAWGDIMRERLDNLGDSFSVCIVENKREGQRVQQKVVCYLGCVDEKKIALPRFRIFFWKQATARLDALKLSEVERAQIETKLGEKVPKVEGQEYESHQEMLKANQADWDRMVAAFRSGMKTRRQQAKNVVP